MAVLTNQRLQTNLWERLTAPHPSITDIEQRRLSSLLTVVLVSLSALIGLTGLRQVYVDLAFNNGDWYTVVVILIYELLAIPVIVLNRLGHYQTSARIFIALGFGLITLYSAFDSNGAFMYPLAVLMSAIFLSNSETVFVVGLAMTTLFVRNLVVGQSVTALAFGSYMAALTLAFVRVRTQVEAERQQELRGANTKLRESESALQHANVTLEDKVSLRTAELEAAKNDAERANVVKSAFLASMSHELRTPLNAVINFTKFVASGDMGPVNSDQEETLNEVVSSAKHLLNLINDVLDMSKIEAGSLNLFVEDDVNLRLLLTSVEPIAKTLLEDKPVELIFTIDDALPLMRIDRQRILQVLLNIMSNACKFTKQGTIALDARASGDEVIILIKDSGPGIAPEDQVLVFEAFKQTEAGLRQGGGTGLGMPISKNLVESHGGRLWMESEAGKGAAFFVALPIKSANLVPMFSALEGVR